MDRTAVRDLEQALALAIRKLSRELELALDAVELSFFGLAMSAILRVHFAVAQANGHTIQRELLVVRVQTHGHRSAGPERGAE